MNFLCSVVEDDGVYVYVYLNVSVCQNEEEEEEELFNCVCLSMCERHTTERARTNRYIHMAATMFSLIRPRLKLHT